MNLSNVQSFLLAAGLWLSLASIAPAQVIFGPNNPIISQANIYSGLVLQDWADMDLDGDLDLIFYHPTLELVWAENLDGRGSMGTILHIVTFDHLGIDDLVAIDIDEDGDMDILTGNDFTEGMIWYENLDGLGTFDGSSQTTPINFVKPQVIKAVDVDLDGDLDVFASGRTSIGWMTNKGGANSFEPNEVIVNFSGNSSTTKPFILLRDMDSDSDLDLISTSDLTNQLFYNRLELVDSFFYSTPVLLDELNNTGRYISIATDDFDGDNDQDILSCAYYFASDSLFIYWHENLDGEGDFSAAQPVTTFEKIMNSNELKFFDLDEDGRMDFSYSTDPNTLWSKGSGGATPFSDFRLLDSTRIFPKFAVDIDDDGDADLLGQTVSKELIAEKIDNTPTYKKNLFDGKQGLLDGVQDIPFFDIDQDGDLDFVIAGREGRFALYENINATFSEHSIANLSTAGGNGAHGADIDADGDLDLILYYATQETAVLFENVDGKGCFEFSKTVSNRMSGIIALVDMDGDMDVDILYNSNLSGRRLIWKENDGQGNFINEHIVSGLSSSIKDHKVVDLDGDGDTDILFIYQSNPAWLENLDGKGNFGPAQLISDDYPIELTAVDMDTDGDLDVVGRSGNEFTWYENSDGLGNFNNKKVIATGSPAEWEGYIVADFDVDGDTDILTTHRHNSNDSSFILFYENIDGAGNFELSKDSMLLVDRIIRMYTEDMDGDSDADLILVANSRNRGDKVNWLQNLALETALAGQCFLDANENAIQDTDEIGLVNQVIQVTPGAINSYSFPDGSFKFAVGADDYQVRIFPSSNWRVSTPEVYDLNVVDRIVPNVNFGLVPKREIVEVSSTIASAPARCRFDVPFWLRFYNSGTLHSSGKMQFEIDSLSTLVRAFPEPDSIIGQTLIWNFDNLPPTYDQEMQLVIQLRDARYLGDTLSFQSRTFIENDQGALEENKTYSYRPILNCAYDPNDKQVNPTGLDEPGYIPFDETLEYTIRFQNTGTDTAFNIRLEDTLDLHLDWSTFEPIAASHPYQPSLNTENGALAFLFENILLPDSTTNEIASHGFVKFNIQHRSGLPNNTEIRNTAFIYFDFNPPIQTNTTLNTLSTFLTHTIEPEPRLQLTVIPNPFHSTTRLVLERNDGIVLSQVKLFNLHGQLIRSYPFRQVTELEINGRDLSAGIYFYQVVDEQERIRAAGKIIKSAVE